MMRTTVTLDDDTVQLVRERMAKTHASFKQALNDAIRDGAHGRPPRPVFHQRTFDMGVPRVPIDKAMQLAAELEDAEIVRKLERGA